MRIGIWALAFAFLASGVMYLVRPAGNWKPTGADPAEPPPPELLRRNRGIGVLWCALGLLVGAYAVVLVARGA